MPLTDCGRFPMVSRVNQLIHIRNGPFGAIDPLHCCCHVFSFVWFSYFLGGCEKSIYFLLPYRLAFGLDSPWFFFLLSRCSGPGVLRSSAGQEGPLIHIGVCIASFLQRICGALGLRRAGMPFHELLDSGKSERNGCGLRVAGCGLRVAKGGGGGER